MSCCRHPVSKLVNLAGYSAFAKMLDAALVQADGVFGDEVRKDAVQDILVQELNLAPTTLAEIVDQIFDVLESGSPYATDWGYARDAILKSFAWRSFDDPFGVVEDELGKLGKHWKEIRRIASEEVAA